MKLEPYQFVAIILIIGIAVIIFTAIPDLSKAIMDFFRSIFKSPYEYEFIGQSAEKVEISEGICLVNISSTLINRGLPMKNVTVKIELSDVGGKRIDYKEVSLGDMNKLESKKIYVNFTTNCDEIGGVFMDIKSYEKE